MMDILKSAFGVDGLSALAGVALTGILTLIGYIVNLFLKRSEIRFKYKYDFMKSWMETLEKPLDRMSVVGVLDYNENRLRTELIAYYSEHFIAKDVNEIQQNFVKASSLFFRTYHLIKNRKYITQKYIVAIEKLKISQSDSGNIRKQKDYVIEMSIFVCAYYNETLNVLRQMCDEIRK